MLTNFGRQLKALRIENDQVLHDMAEILGCTAAYLSAVENGKRAVPDAWISILEQRYCLSEHEIKELQQTAYENKSTIKLSLEGSSKSETDLALSFARKFKNLSDEQMEDLKKILDGIGDE